MYNIYKCCLIKAFGYYLSVVKLVYIKISMLCISGLQCPVAGFRSQIKFGYLNLCILHSKKRQQPDSELQDLWRNAIFNDWDGKIGVGPTSPRWSALSKNWKYFQYRTVMVSDQAYIHLQDFYKNNALKHWINLVIIDNNFIYFVIILESAPWVLTDFSAITKTFLMARIRCQTSQILISLNYQKFLANIRGGGQ